MDSSTTSVSRRTLIASAVALAAVGASAPGALASGRTRDSVPLPIGLQPEGITSGPGTTYYAGSLANGRILTGELTGGGTRVLLKGANGRSLRGLFHDDRTGIVWAVGNVGARAHVYAVSRLNGRIIQDTIVPGGTFLNDVVALGDSLWVTDSSVDRLTRIPLKRGGGVSGAPAEIPPAPRRVARIGWNHDQRQRNSRPVRRIAHPQQLPRGRALERRPGDRCHDRDPRHRGAGRRQW